MTSASPSRLGTIIFLLLATLGAANVLLRRHDVFPLLSRQNEIPEEPPLCRAPCDLNTCGGGGCRIGSSLSRRSAGLDGLIETFAQLNISEKSHDHFLAKRIFRYDTTSNKYAGDRFPTVEEVDAYLPAVFRGKENRYFGDFLPLVDASEDERAFSQQVEFGNNAFQIMTGGLHGCTVVALVSRRAVWMAHFWEVYSNGDVGRDPPALDPVFKDRVIKHLTGEVVTNPAPSVRPYIAPTGPSIDKSLFDRDDDETKLYIMTPVADRQPAGSTALQYGKRVTLIQTTIKNHLGRRPKTVRYGYKALDYSKPEEEALENQSNRGMCLFQFDPNSDGEGQRGWRLFMELSFARDNSN